MFGKEKHSNPLSRIDLISLKKLDKSSGKNCNKSNHIFLEERFKSSYSIPVKAVVLN